MNVAGAETYVIDPSASLILWTALAFVLLAFGIVTALKTRWGWFVIGMFIPVVWIFSAFAAPTPTSLWHRVARRLRATSTKL